MAGLILEDYHGRCTAALITIDKVVWCIIQPMADMLQREIDACQQQAFHASKS